MRHNPQDAFSFYQFTHASKRHGHEFHIACAMLYAHIWQSLCMMTSCHNHEADNNVKRASCYLLKKLDFSCHNLKRQTSYITCLVKIIILQSIVYLLHLTRLQSSRLWYTGEGVVFERSKTTKNTGTGLWHHKMSISKLLC